MEGGRRPSRGDLVASKTNGLGPGKAIGKSASGAVLVEYFDSVADGGRHTIEAPISDLRPFTLHRESRCYWDTNGGGALAGSCTLTTTTSSCGHQTPRTSDFLAE